MEIHQWEKKNKSPAFMSLTLEKEDNLMAMMMLVAMERCSAWYSIQDVLRFGVSITLYTGRLGRAQ